MKFQKNVKREIRELLEKQLKEYESNVKLTKEERRELHEWVASGQSPYDNGSYLCDCTGVPLDFVHALRLEKEFLDWFEALPEDKQAAYLDESVQYDTYADEFCFNISRLGISQESFEEGPF